MKIKIDDGKPDMTPFEKSDVPTKKLECGVEIALEDELKNLGMAIHDNKSPNRRAVDFSIMDKALGDSVAEVWGYSFNDIDWDCTHPIECVTFDDDNLAGQCELCGCHCDAHYEADDGNVEGFYWSGRRLVPHEWYPRREVGGLIKKILDEMKGE